MKIVHVLTPARFGGLERVVQSLAVEQARSGHAVVVAAVVRPGQPEHPMIGMLRERGVDARALPAASRAYRRERQLVADLCAEITPDIVHTHGYRTDVLHGGVARARGIATVATAHGFTGGDWKNLVYEWLQRRAWRRYDATVAVSRRLRNDLLAAGLPDERLHCVPNAWADPPTFLDRDAARRQVGLPEAGWYAGFIGRLGLEKGPDIFIDAMGTVIRGPDSADIHAAIIGDGPMREALTARATATGIDQRVAFAGPIDNAGSCIRALDVLVISSRTEGTPMVLLEAMAAGVPIVTTAVGGIPDVVSQGEAVVVPPDAAAIAAAIYSVHSDPDSARERAGRANARLASEFGASQWRARYDAIYEACATARSQTARTHAI